MENKHSGAKSRTNLLNTLKAVRSDRKMMAVLAIALVGLLVIGFLLAWLYFKVTSPAQLKDSVVNADFDSYIRLFIILMLILFIQDAIYLIRRRFRSWPLNIYILLSTLLILTVVYVGVTRKYINEHPNLEAHNPGYNEHLLDYSKPIDVLFDVPVRVSKLKPSVTPEFKGRWEWEPYFGINGITRKGRFHPEISAFPEARFVIYIAGVNKLNDNREHEYGFVFKAPRLPEVTATIPEDGSKDILRDQQITLEINKRSQELVEWEFEAKPKLTLKIEFTDSNQIRLTPEDPYEQGEEYQITAKYKPKMVNLESGEVVEFGESVEAHQFKFTTVSEPLVEKLTPSGKSVLPTENINVIFEEPFDKESLENHFEIKPKVEGEIIWKSDIHFKFEPAKDLPKDTKFTVIFKKGLKSKTGGELEKDVQFQFTTLGRVLVDGISPGNGATGASENSQIKVTFNQEVDKASAQSLFSLSPGVSGSFSWAGYTLIYTLSKSLNFQTKYTVTIKSGVKSVHGLDSNTSFAYSFTTRSNVFSFKIPILYQPTGFTCNIFTARMILAWKGVSSSNHVTLISEIGYNDDRDGDSWTGNPYKEYIGNADGSWGYGVYYPPIQKVLTARGISSKAYTGWNKVALAKEVAKGNPVIIWRYNGVGGGQDISWTASDGTYVKAFNGMHGTIISGYTGTTDNPTSFYVNDPWLGQFWMPTSTLDGYWSYTNRMALVVYK